MEEQDSANCFPIQSFQGREGSTREINKDIIIFQRLSEGKIDIGCFSMFSGVGGFELGIEVEEE